MVPQGWWSSRVVCDGKPQPWIFYAQVRSASLVRVGFCCFEFHPITSSGRIISLVTQGF